MTSAPTPLKNPATLEAADTLERILDLRTDSDRLDPFPAAVAAFVRSCIRWRPFVASVAFLARSLMAACCLAT